MAAVTRLTKSDVGRRATGGRSCFWLVASAGTSHLLQSFERHVDRGEVLLDDRLAALAVRLADGRLDVLDRLLARQNPGEGKEAGLHRGVDPRPHAGLPGNIISIHHDRTAVACR